MLILTRKSGELIRIGDAVTVRVLEIRGNQVRLGVEAPGDVRIYREEVYRAIQKEQGEAPESDAPPVSGLPKTGKP
jgi:carbon storage regulator